MQPKDPALRAECEALIPDIKRLIKDVEDYVALRCPVCERDVTDPENRERLFGVNPFCSRGECPYRRR